MASDKEREAQRQVINRKILLVARKHELKLRRELKRAMIQAANDFLKHKDVERSALEHRENLNNIISGMMLDASQTFALDFVETSKKSARQPRILKDASTIIERITIALSQFISEHTGSLVVDISETTMNDIKTITNKVIYEGMTEDEAMKEIRKLSAAFPAYRARRIARTEVHRAANASRFEAVSKLNLNVQKVWVASKSPRTRKAHLEADGQKVGRDELFIVNGERLRYPNDPSGSAANTINCRCVTVFEFD